MKSRTRINSDVALANFNRHMMNKLDAASNKPHWSEHTAGYLLMRLKQEVIELEQAIFAEEFTNKDITLECADVANFAMMIADNVKGEL